MTTLDSYCTRFEKFIGLELIDETQPCKYETLIVEKKDLALLVF